MGRRVLPEFGALPPSIEITDRVRAVEEPRLVRVRERVVRVIQFLDAANHAHDARSRLPTYVTRFLSGFRRVGFADGTIFLTPRGFCPRMAPGDESVEFAGIALKLGMR